MTGQESFLTKKDQTAVHPLHQEGMGQMTHKPQNVNLTMQFEIP